MPDTAVAAELIEPRSGQGGKRTGPTPSQADVSAVGQRIDVLMHEYDAVSEQILNWHAQLWQKSQFFIAIEAISLGIVTQWLLPTIQPGNQIAAPNIPSAAVVSFAAAVNLFLCYGWFRIGRSHMEHVSTRERRAREIEDHPLLLGTLRLYHRADELLGEQAIRHHSSSWWTRHIPSPFILSWLAVLGLEAAGGLTQPSLSWPPVAMAITVAVAALTMIGLGELRGWPAGSR